MRFHTLVPVALVLLLSNEVTAQRVPLPGSRRAGPAQPVPLSPQPAPIARATTYQRSRWSVETYPLISYMSVPGPNAISHWSSFGTGTRAEYRTSSSITATVDMTSSIFGGPASTQTVELGSRYRPVAWDHPLRPYADLRVAYLRSGGYSSPLDATVPLGGVDAVPYGVQYSRGFGGVAGAGMEYWIAQRFALTTGVSAVRSRMSTYRYTGTSFPSDPAYSMTTYRLTLGLRFNPVRTVQLQ